MMDEDKKRAYAHIEELARKIETEKPWGCHVYRPAKGVYHFSFGVPKEDLVGDPILPMPDSLCGPQNPMPDPDSHPLEIPAFLRRT